jgi:tRNA G18 (ribose-2'-O)-methylase SpoU
LPIIELSDTDDPRLAAYALAAEPARLRQAGWFVAEGRLVVERLLRAARYHVESLLLHPSAWRALEPLLGNAPLFPVYVCPPAAFLRLTGHDFHRGCLGLVRRPEPLSVERFWQARTLLVLEGVANADNLGGVFRNAAAFGVDGVLLDPSSSDPLYRKAIRTSMGATLSVPFATLGETGRGYTEAVDEQAAESRWPDCLSQLRARGFELLALTPQSPSMDLAEYAALPGRAGRVALLIGAEGPGLSQRALERATVRLRIPMRAEVDSLNLAVACGIALDRLVPVSARP